MVKRRFDTLVMLVRNRSLSALGVSNERPVSVELDQEGQRVARLLEVAQARPEGQVWPVLALPVVHREIGITFPQAEVAVVCFALERVVADLHALQRDRQPA